MTSQPHDKRIKLSHFGNPNYSGNTMGPSKIFSLAGSIDYLCRTAAFASLLSFRKNILGL